MQAKRIGLFLGPLVFAFLLLLPGPETMVEAAWKTLALGAFMLIWWVTEAVPLPVTALLPLTLLPVIGVLPLKEAAAPYANPVVFLFMGGFMIALAMERWGLHRRIALNIVRLTGTNANGIILGFMLATAGLSMWISNTATTVLMLPIALSVVGLLLQGQDGAKSGKRFALALMLGIAYAANIGGTATIIGTPPNVVFSGILRQEYGLEVTFQQWFVFGFPFAFLLLMITYFILVRVLFPNRLGGFSGARELIKREIEKLGEIGPGEKGTLWVFGLTALAWIFRTQLVNLLPGLNLSDTGIAMLATVTLFVSPVNWKKQEYLLQWQDTEKLPWGILLLFGGGLSLANALSETGLIDLVGSQFQQLEKANLLVIIGLTAVSLFLTEIMSNVALVTVFLPVVGAIALGMGASPVILCIPVTLAASCAFMLPMSTPPNAIVFASGYLTVAQMVRAGFLLNIIAILWIGVLSKLVLPLLFS